MRISFGGGRGRGPFSPRISFELGPVASCVVSVFIILVGIFALLISFGNIIVIIIGIIFIALGVFEFRANKRKIKSKEESGE